MKKVLIYIVSYQRKSYTQGTIHALRKHKLDDTEIVVCDNGSTDGTREWLTENKHKYNFKTIFPDSNLRVGGAWTLLTKLTKPDEYDYIILLDNDGWVLPYEGWLDKCFELFSSDNRIVSLGLQKERRPGYYSMEKNYDPNYETRIKFNNDIEIYNTIYYAAFRMDRFAYWHEAMSNWPHKFIGEKLNYHYQSLGKITLKITPGFILDISEFNFDNQEHMDYNVDFYKRERDQEEFNRRTSMHSTTESVKDYLVEVFGEEFLSYL